ncbi:MAG: CocE/NonD family hydrolase [Myxococcota bacterium]
MKWKWPHSLAGRRRNGMLLAGICSLPLLGMSTCDTPDLYVPMQDGTLLHTQVFETGKRATPTVVTRTPQLLEGWESLGKSFNDHGYNLLAQSVRGAGDSAGVFDLYRADGWSSLQDGLSTLSWADAQEWSSDAYCAVGGGEAGSLAYLLAGSGSESLQCLYVQFGSPDLYDLLWSGGALHMEVLDYMKRFLPNSGWETAIASQYDPSRNWEGLRLQDQVEDLSAPMYMLSGWYDVANAPTLRLFEALQTGGNLGPGGNPPSHRLVIGPWSRFVPGPTIGELTYPSNATISSDEQWLWLDRWLKGARNGIDTEAPVLYYRMGDPSETSTEWNVWLSSDVWPVPSTPLPFYLSSDGGLSLQPQLSNNAPRTYRYDPNNLIATRGGANLLQYVGPMDQASIEKRDDVLVYSSEVFQEPLAITGEVIVKLWVSTSARDTDFVVRLTDVYPDGRSMLVSDQLQRLRFRDGPAKEALAEPGQIYPLTLSLGYTSQVFNKGHQVRISVSSSNYPRFDYNRNDGAPLETPGEGIPAEQAVYSNTEFPSMVLLPKVPLSTANAGRQ